MSYSLRLFTKKKVILIASVVLFVSLFVFLGKDKDKTEDDVLPKNRAVSTESVKNLSLMSTPLPLSGTVTSRNEAVVRAESSGKLVQVRKKLGDYVSAGEIIAEFENSTERAQVLSAEGAYESAQSGQGIAEINRNSADSALKEARTASLNTLNSVYVIFDDAIRLKTDGVYRNPQTRNPELFVNMSDSRLLISLPSQRLIIEELLRAREARNRTLTITSDLELELRTIESEATTIKIYLDDLALGLSRGIADNSAPQATIDTAKASTALARTAIAGALSTITTSRNALNSAVVVTSIAEENYTQNNDSKTASSEAVVKSALGNLNGAQARLEKTIIRSPISGTINSLLVQTGDYIAPFTEVAVISNNGALEIVSYITESDVPFLRVGAKVKIERTLNGVITRIAPALDPKTKKIEVKIGITDTRTQLVNGQSVHVEATRMKQDQRTTDTTFTIPLSALKLTPSGSYVFTVSASTTLVAHPVKEGALSGEQITITEGLTPEMEIVLDVRGLKEGETIIVNK